MKHTFHVRFCVTGFDIIKQSEVRFSWYRKATSGVLHERKGHANEAIHTYREILGIIAILDEEHTANFERSGSQYSSVNLSYS